MVTVTDNLITVTVTINKGMNMKLRCTKSGLDYVAGEEYLVMNQNKVFWFIIVNKIQKKVTKSSGLLAGAPKGGPSFELVTVTETQLDLIPQKRRVGRPKTGTALTPAQKQAAYRARKAQKSVTVTFNRDDIKALQMILANAEGSFQDVSDDVCKRLFDSVWNAGYDAGIFGS